MTANGLKALIFDLDDTLYPESAFVVSGFRAVAVWGSVRWAISAAEIEAELMKLFEDGVRGNTFGVWLQSHNLWSTDVESEMVEVYRGHFPQIAPYPEVINVLQACREEYLVGLVSDGQLSVQKNKFQALRLDSYFAEVMFSDELGRDNWKPSPRPFETVLQRMGVPPRSSVYIADNVKKDFLAPRSLGMGTIQVRRPDGLYANVVAMTNRHAAHAIASDLNEAMNLLKTLGWD